MDALRVCRRPENQRIDLLLFHGIIANDDLEDLGRSGHGCDFQSLDFDAQWESEQEIRFHEAASGDAVSRKIEEKEEEPEEEKTPLEMAGKLQGNIPG